MKPEPETSFKLPFKSAIAAAILLAAPLWMTGCNSSSTNTGFFPAPVREVPTRIDAKYMLPWTANKGRIPLIYKCSSAACKSRSLAAQKVQSVSKSEMDLIVSILSDEKQTKQFMERFGKYLAPTINSVRYKLVGGLQKDSIAGFKTITTKFVGTYQGVPVKIRHVAIMGKTRFLKVLGIGETEKEAKAATDKMISAWKRSNTL